MHRAVRLDRGPGGRLVAVERSTTSGPRIISPPASPSGTVTPGSSIAATRASAPGSAKPIEPCTLGTGRSCWCPRPRIRSSPRSRAAGRRTGVPTVHLGRRAWSRPPTVQIRSEDRSATGQRRVGEHHRVHRRHAVEYGRTVVVDLGQRTAGSKRSIITSVAPAMKVPFITTLP